MNKLLKVSLRFLLVSAVTVFLLSSCVSNRKYMLMQKDDVNKSDLPKDTVLRSYDPVSFEYRIQPEDILSVRFESLTSKDFDFLNQNLVAQQGLSLMQNSPLLVGELVDQNGEIPFPFLGKIKVSGLTIFEIQDTLDRKSTR